MGVLDTEFGLSVETRRSVPKRVWFEWAGAPEVELPSEMPKWRR